MFMRGKNFKFSEGDELITDSAETAWPPSSLSARCNTELNASIVGNPCELEGNSTRDCSPTLEDRFGW